MSDNEDLLGDIGDQSLADYNLGNDEEDKLLADDFEHNENGPSAAFNQFTNDYPVHPVEYRNQAEIYTIREERVVPNLTVEVPRPSYAPYEPPKYNAGHQAPIVPAPMMGVPIESPQIVPSEDIGDRRAPRVRDIPDTLDKVVVPRGFAQRGSRTSWRNPHYSAYRRNNVHRGNFQHRPTFPPPNQILRPQIHPEPQIRLPPPPQIPDPLPHIPRPQMLPENDDERIVSLHKPPFQPFQQVFRPQMDPMRPNLRPQFPFQRPMMQPRPFVPIHEPLIPQVTIRQAIPFPQKIDEFGGQKMGVNPMNQDFTPSDQEVRMLPIHLSQNLPPGGLQGKKVLINPHFKGNFQPPMEGIATYIPTRIQKSPIPIQPTIDIPLGPPKDIDDAAERFIAEQRNALARANNRKLQKRSPQRYIENTTIEIENEQFRDGRARPSSDDDLLRRQEEFISANRAGLRRRMRSPSPPRRASPRRSPSPRRPRERSPNPAPNDEESEYRRRMREQELIRERVTRAKEQRRRKHAALLDREKERQQQQEKEKEKEKEKEREKEKEKVILPPKEIEISPPVQREPIEPKIEPPPKIIKKEDPKTPPREKVKEIPPKKEKKPESPVREVKQPVKTRTLTPPLPEKKKDDKVDYDFDDLELILNDFEGILSDDEDSGRFKENPKKVESQKAKSHTDLRSKLIQKPVPSKPILRQKIVFSAEPIDNNIDKTPPKRNIPSSPKNESDNSNDKFDNDTENIFNPKRQRITFNTVKTQLKQKLDEKSKTSLTFNRRVVLQRKIEKTRNDPTKPTPGLFTRAIRNTIPEVKPKVKEPQIFYDSSDDESPKSISNNLEAKVSNLPHGITDTRLRTLAGPELQSLILNKEDRSAKITFKSTIAAEIFKKKFNNKLVAASKLSVTLL